MTDKPENPNAFPEILSAWVWDKNEEGVLEIVKNDRALTQPGMTLRDYFAAKAMQSLVANPDSTWNRIEQDYETIATSIANNSYFMADAMLKARQS